MMSDLIFVLSDQNGDLVGHMSFQEKTIYLQPWRLFKYLVYFESFLVVFRLCSIEFDSVRKSNANSHTNFLVGFRSITELIEPNHSIRFD